MTESTNTPPWAAGLPTSRATSSVAPAHSPQPSPSEHRPAESPQKTKIPKKLSRLHTVALSMIVVVLVVVAGVMIWKAFNPERVEAPLPSSEFDKPADGVVVGPVGDAPVEIADGKSMTAEDMAADTLFVPALGVYMPIESDSTFEESVYQGFETLKVPHNAQHGVWYAGGAPMYGGEQGTTLIASHASGQSGWGALRFLYKLKGGEMIYTKDAAGQLQSWQMTKMRVEDHKSFPQEYWSAEGERLLVLTTCGGKVNSSGTFSQNIFAVAVPVDPKPKTQAQRDAEEVIAAVGALAIQKHAEALAAAKQAQVQVQVEVQPQVQLEKQQAPVKQPVQRRSKQPVTPEPQQPVEQVQQPVKPSQPAKPGQPKPTQTPQPSPLPTPTQAPLSTEPPAEQGE